MPKKITPHQRARYRRLRNTGVSQVEAAAKSGFSRSYARKLEAEGYYTTDSGSKLPLSHTQVVNEEEREEALRPKRVEELSDIARDCLKDFERFRSRYLGSVSTPWQTEAAQKIIEYQQSPEKTYVVLNMPQGSGKTRLVHDLTAWLIVRDRSIRIINGSLAQNLSVSASSNVRDTLERTVPVIARELDRKRGLARDADVTLAQDYGRFKPSASGGLWRRDQFIVEQLDGASMEKDPTMAAFSREAKFLGWRVDFAVWDDLVNTDMLRNQDRVADLYQWWDVDAESRVDTGGLLLLVGQRLRSNDIYRYCLDKKVVADEFDAADDAERRPQYHHVVFKAHYDELCTGDHRRDAPPYPAGCLLDPNRITPRDIKEKQAAGTFEVVYQQEDTDPASALVQRAWVNGGTANDGTEHEGCWDKDRFIGQIPHIPPGSYVIRYMTVDPSPTKWWGIGDWIYVLPPGVEPMAGYRYLVNLARQKMPANEFLDYSQRQNSFVGIAEEWVQDSKKSGLPITYLIMEKNAAQRWAMQYEFFENWRQTRGINVIPHETTSNKADPELGVWATLPAVYRYGRIRLPAGDTKTRTTVHPLVQEVTTYPNGTTDDCLMSQWFGEYNLQHLVALRKLGGKMHSGVPSWMKER